MAKLTQYAFRKKSRQVALDILGNELVRKYPNGEVTRAYIKVVSPHTGDAAKSADEGIAQKAGIINVGKPRYNQRLLDITTGKQGEASCVTLRGIVLAETGEEIEGPGNSTKVLNIHEGVNGLDVENRVLFITDRKDPDYDPAKVRGPIKWPNKPKNSPGFFTY